jgi:hypothetical protein
VSPFETIMEFYILFRWQRNKYVKREGEGGGKERKGASKKAALAVEKIFKDGEMCCCRLWIERGKEKESVQSEMEKKDDG